VARSPNSLGQLEGDQRGKGATGEHHRKRPVDGRGARRARASARTIRETFGFPTTREDFVVRTRFFALARNVAAFGLLLAIPVAQAQGTVTAPAALFRAPAQHPASDSGAGTATTASALATVNGTFGDVSVVQVAPYNGGEPSIATGPEGHLYYSYPGGPGMAFYRSTDQGQTWTAGALADTQSGDTSVNVDASGAVYESNLNGFTFDADMLQGVVYKSLDGGAHWSKGAGFLSGSNSTNNPALVDRQWADAYIPPGKTTDQALVYFSYHDWGPSQVWVNKSSDGGKTFGAPVDVITSPEAEAATFCDSIPGGIKVAQAGPHAGRVYVSWLGGSVATDAATGCNVTQLNTFNTIWVAWSDDQGATWTDHLVFDGGIGHDASGLFSDLTLDNAGNPYVGFADNLTGEWDMYVMASFDGGTTWNGKTDGTGTPYKVNSDTGTHFFPAIAVGDPGRVDVAWIRTSNVIPTTAYGKPTPGGGDGAVWYAYMAQSVNLLSGSPTWNVTQATPTSIHTGDVCTLGIFCIDATTGLPVTGADRSLLDFIDISVGRDGFAHAAFTANQSGGLTGMMVANQVSGTRAYTPTLALAAGTPAGGAYTTTVNLSAVTHYVDTGTPVTFTVGGQSVTAPVGSDGVASATMVLSQRPGAYTLTASGAGLSASAPFAITKDATTLTAVRKTKTLQATLKAAGSLVPVAGRTVRFFVNGTSVGTAVTNANGVAVLKHPTPKRTAVTATFGGDTYFLASQSG